MPGSDWPIRLAPTASSRWRIASRATSRCSPTSRAMWRPRWTPCKTRAASAQKRRRASRRISRRSMPGSPAIEIDPGDVWGTHAVAHIMEMQGRHAEGIAWLDELERNWEGAANLVHHLWWHRALFHLERREVDAVLDLYDRRFRNLGSPLTLALPDLYIDVQNAASMLFRLELLGVEVGDRWTEIADKAEARIGDC